MLSTQATTQRTSAGSSPQPHRPLSSTSKDDYLTTTQRIPNHNVIPSLSPKATTQRTSAGSSPQPHNLLSIVTKGDHPADVRWLVASTTSSIVQCIQRRLSHYHPAYPQSQCHSLVVTKGDHPADVRWVVALKAYHRGNYPVGVPMLEPNNSVKEATTQRTSAG
ncbi:hypothetical protein ACG7TL_007867 [Trametes sanguinea]